MAIIRWNPLDIPSLLGEGFELPTALSRFGLGQGLNLYETEDEVVAEAALPGVSEDKIDVTYENGVVRISGSREEIKEETGKRRHFMAALESSYNYSFRLPGGLVTDEEPEAELNNGILTLRFKKTKKAPPRKIRISAKSKGTKEAK